MKMNYEWMWKKLLSVFLVVSMVFGMPSAGVTVRADGMKQMSVMNGMKNVGAGSGKKSKKVSKSVRNKYFHKSAFIGSSIGVGQKMYFDSQGKGYLGNPTMLVRGCYSLANDKCLHSQYSLVYRGSHYRAKDALALSKVKRAFINMGTNDLWKPAKDTYKDYVEYLSGIRKKNPNLVIFIEGTAPMCTARCRGNLTNHEINTLNRLMEDYCKKHKDMYYVDISKGMRDQTGGLKSSCSSDGYVHLTMTGYSIWMKNVIAYVDKLILQEEAAKNAVAKAKKTKAADDYQRAKKLVEELDKSTTKDKLKKKLKAVKVIKEPEQNVPQPVTDNR